MANAQVYTFTNGWTMKREEQHAWCLRNRWGEEENRGWDREKLITQHQLTVEKLEEVPVNG